MKSKKGCILSFLLVLFIFGVTIPLFMTNHKKVKADGISDLTDTTWIINATPTLNPPRMYLQHLNFTSNNQEFSMMYIGYIPELDNESDIWYYGSTPSYVQAYSSPNWSNQAYRTITITGGSDVTNSSLITWLINNAEQQVVTGTEITHRYWAPMGAIRMTDNQVIGDENITYTVLFNEQRRQYDETTQTGLIYKGLITTDDPSYSYIESINGTGINILYRGDTSVINNSMWLEFTTGDYMDSDLYTFMDLWGLWFDDANAYLVGTNQGYVEGTIHGRALGQADGTQYEGLITGIFNGLGGLLSIQVFPNITIALLIGLPLLLGVFIIIIKILRG